MKENQADEKRNRIKLTKRRNNQRMNKWRTNNRTNHRMNMQANEWTKLIKNKKQNERVKESTNKKHWKERTKKLWIEGLIGQTEQRLCKRTNEWTEKRRMNEWSHGTMGKKEKAKKSIDWKSTNE